MTDKIINIEDRKADGIDKLKNKLIEASDPWQIFTLKDAFKEREPLQYIIGGLFPLPSLSIVYGASGSLKSMLLADAMANVVKGKSWLGREVIKAPALWIDFDNGKRRTHERMEAIARHLDLPEEAPFYYVSMPHPPLDAGSQESIAELQNRIESRGIKLVIIDNLKLISPNQDENSDGMSKVMSNLRYLAENTGCAVVVIHHQRKGNGKTNGRIGESIRGHSSIEASLDLALLVTRDGDSDFIEIKSTKTRDVDVYPFGAEYRYEHKEGGTELLTSCFVPSELEDNSPDNAIMETITNILMVEPGTNQTKLIAKLKDKKLFKAGENKLKAIIREMEKKKTLLFKTGKQGSKEYYIDSINNLP
jgi:RecA-family ATPase